VPVVFTCGGVVVIGRATVFIHRYVILALVRVIGDPQAVTVHNIHVFDVPAAVPLTPFGPVDGDRHIVRLMLLIYATGTHIVESEP